MTEQTYLELAARLLGISADQLWDYREGHDGITFRTPDGYRHRYMFDELESDGVDALMAPTRDARGVPRRAWPKACSHCSRHTPENLAEARFTGGISPPGGDYREGLGGISFRTPNGYLHRFTFTELESAEGAPLRAPAGNAVGGWRGC
jgi:hypothetical protein